MKFIFTSLLLASSAFGNPMFTVSSNALNGIVNEPYTAKVSVSGASSSLCIPRMFSLYL